MQALLREREECVKSLKESSTSQVDSWLEIHFLVLFDVEPLMFVLSLCANSSRVTQICSHKEIMYYHVSAEKT